MKNLELNINGLKPRIGRVAHSLRKYASVLIFIAFTGIYGFLTLQINSLSNPSIEESLVLSESKTVPLPRIDENAAQKLLSLQDNSVNVQTLFDQSRTNPFQE